MQAASAKKRFANLIIDQLFFSMILGFMVGLLIGVGVINQSATNLIIILGIFLQPLLMEYFFGASLGKMVTRTRVIHKDGGKPSFRQILLRTLIRFVPFESFSFLRKNPIGWHDSHSDTMVVDKNQINDDYLMKVNPDRHEKKIQYIPTIIFLLIYFGLFFIFPAFLKWKVTSEITNKQPGLIEVLNEEEGADRPKLEPSTIVDSWQEYFLSQDKFKMSFPTEPVQSTNKLNINNRIVELLTFKSSASGELFQVSYTDISDLYDSKYSVVDISVDDSEVNPALENLKQFESQRRDHYQIASEGGKQMKEDIYQALFDMNVGSREFEKVSDSFYGNNSYDFLWKNSDRGVFIKGKIIIVDNKDLYIMINENEIGEFPQFEQFIYSWQSFGELSE